MSDDRVEAPRNERGIFGLVWIEYLPGKWAEIDHIQGIELWEMYVGPTGEQHLKPVYQPGVQVTLAGPEFRQHGFESEAERDEWLDWVFWCLEQFSYVLSRNDPAAVGARSYEGLEKRSRELAEAGA